MLQRTKDTKGRTRELLAKSNVQLASGADLKKWAGIGPRSVAAATRYVKPPAAKEGAGAAPPAVDNKQR